MGGVIVGSVAPGPSADKQRVTGRTALPVPTTDVVLWSDAEPTPLDAAPTALRRKGKVLSSTDTAATEKFDSQIDCPWESFFTAAAGTRGGARMKIEWMISETDKTRVQEFIIGLTCAVFERAREASCHSSADCNSMATLRDQPNPMKKSR